MSWVQIALNGEPVYSIGQLSAQDIRDLNREVRAGRLIRIRDYWYKQGGLGLGPLKTIWCRPSFPPHEIGYPRSMFRILCPLSRAA